MEERGTPEPLVGVIMGSASDWETMRQAAETLERFGVAHERRVVSAHRTPDLMASYAKEAEDRGLEVIVAGAGGAAHLPGMIAAHTTVPVPGAPVASRARDGRDPRPWAARRRRRGRGAPARHDRRPHRGPGARRPRREPGAQGRRFPPLDRPAARLRTRRHPRPPP